MDMVCAALILRGAPFTRWDEKMPAADQREALHMFHKEKMFLVLSTRVPRAIVNLCVLLLIYLTNDSPRSFETLWTKALRPS